MPTVIFLASWTEAGIKDIKNSPKRYDESVALLENMGGKVKGFYLVTGDYDMIVIAEMPADAVPKFVLKLAHAGAVRTKTIHAWTEAEYRDIIASL